MSAIDTEDGRDGGIRLAKRVAASVPCSRAEAERYIAGGWVSVDGAVVEDPATRVTPAQEVALLPGASAAEPLPVTIVLNKPAGLDAAGALALLGPGSLAADAQGPRFLKRHLARLSAATPLAATASGLVVFSQDWRVLRKLVDDGDRLEHEYVAEVTGAIAEGGLERLNQAVRRNGKLAAVKVSWQSEARLRFAGKDIRVGQIEAMCEEVGLRLAGLRRLRVGRVSLAGLEPGRWRYLGEFERF